MDERHPTVENDQVPTMCHDAMNVRHSAKMDQGQIVCPAATVVDNPARMRSEQKSDPGAKQVLQRAKWNPVWKEEPGIWLIPFGADEEIQNVEGKSVAETWMKRYVDEPSWNGIAEEAVDDESGGSDVPWGCEKQRLPVCQGFLNET